MIYPMSIELAFKEIMNLIRVMLRGPDENTHNILKSVYFNYFNSKGKIQIKSNFKLDSDFLFSLT